MNVTHESKTDHTGSRFDSFLLEEGILEKVESAAIKRVIAWQLPEAMNPSKESKKVKVDAA